MVKILNTDIITLDEKGRLLIPKKFLEALNLRPKSKVKVTIENGRLILEPEILKPRKVKANRKWGPEAFLDAGEATFGEF